MSQINFLPDAFQRDHRRQQRRPIEFMVIGCAVAVLMVLWLYTGGPDKALAEQATQLEQRIEKIEQLRAEQDRLHQERAQLQRRLMTARETYQPISATQVLSRLSALTPESIRLITIKMIAQRPAPQAAEEPAAKRRVVGSANRSDQAREANLMKLTITGHAPTDDEVVKLIRQLTADPVFSSVTLRSSKMDKTQTHFVRAFHLDVAIDLDRRFLGDPTHGGKKHAD